MPLAVGVKVTAMVQLLRGASDMPQVVEETLKSPLAAMLEMLSGTFCWLARVTFWAALVKPANNVPR